MLWDMRADPPAPGSTAPEPPLGGRHHHLPWKQVPWNQLKTADKVILWLIAISGLYYLVTVPLVAPLVGSHPALLAIIRGSATAVITLGAKAATGHGSMVVAVCAGLPGTILFDWVFWWAGKRWGDNALHMLFRRGRNPERRIAQVKRLSHRYGWLAVVTGYIIPIPVQLIAVAVGLGGMSLPVYLVLDAIGALIWLGMLAGLGYWIGQSAVDVANAVSHYSLWVTLGIVGLVVARQYRTARHQVRFRRP